MKTKFWPNFVLMGFVIAAGTVSMPGKDSAAAFARIVTIIISVLFMGWGFRLRRLKNAGIEETGTKKPQNPEPKQPVQKFCSFCNQELFVLKDYHCRYCRKDFCPKHRLPEQHDCKKLPKI